MMVLLDTGVRASELTALRMRDYESKRGQLIIHHGKGDKKRVVFLGIASKQISIGKSNCGLRDQCSETAGEQGTTQPSR